MHRKDVLTVTDLSKQFGGFSALRNTTLSVRGGATHAIIGPNGAGKTTLVNVISGLLKPSSGKITLADEDITHASAYHIARLGLVRTFQITSLFADLTVYDNIDVAFVARKKYRLPRLTGAHGVVNDPEEVIQLVGLEAVRDQKVGDISHGDQRLVEVAMALSAEPQILLLDEPTAGMSPLETQRFITLVNTRLKSRYTIVLIEHDMEVVMQTADRLSVLSNGSVLAEGTPEEIMENPVVQEAYLGRP